MNNLFNIFYFLFTSSIPIVKKKKKNGNENIHIMREREWEWYLFSHFGLKCWDFSVDRRIVSFQPPGLGIQCVNQASEGRIMNTNSYRVGQKQFYQLFYLRTGCSVLSFLIYVNILVIMMYMQDCADWAKHVQAKFFIQT